MDTSSSANRHRAPNNPLLKSWRIVLGFFVVAGQVGQNVILPMWIDSTARNRANSTGASNSSGSSHTPLPHDSYFVYSFSCFAFTAFFAVCLAVSKVVAPSSIGPVEYRFPQRHFAVIGALDAVNGLLVVFSASGKRTAPYLQSILGNFLIPMTVVFRFTVLHRLPTVLKAVCAIAVFLSLITCVAPDFIPGLGASTGGGAPGFEGVIWAAIFMIAFSPAALMNVMQEKWLTDDAPPANRLLPERPINIYYFWFFVSGYQSLFALVFFWVDILPWFGNVASLAEMLTAWSANFLCFFGGEGCPPMSTVLGFMFIFSAILSNTAVSALIRITDGATFLAIISALVTPCGFMFWTLFVEKPFHFEPSANNKTWFALGSLLVMIPAIIVYNFPDNIFQKCRPQRSDDNVYLFSEAENEADLRI